MLHHLTKFGRRACGAVACGLFLLGCAWPASAQAPRKPGDYPLSADSLPQAGVPKGRLEAFSDGVLAISTMALEAKLPQGEGVDPLQPLLPLFLSYAPSFVKVGIQ